MKHKHGALFTHSMALLLKLSIVITAVFPLYAALTGASLINIFLITLLLTVVTYPLFDIFVLKRFGIVLATLLEAITSFLVLFAFGVTLYGFALDTVNMALGATFFIVVFEIYFHIYMENQVLHLGEHVYDRKRQLLVPKKLRMESSEELFPEEFKKRTREKKDQD
ncbi:hypothetical protein N781_04010 [Pontibacillus halophilus JSM 076056 = DSM 19796]|uniref:DUF2512 family protein n=2 Tax=Pontibacillus TaxID=289201 RepID=A0A0A5I783_9BACI|nr:DUF2512 family protein [Pontibacillus halophilus]KGX91697.1 hypothetical protein N781_04010 [Pontibacillus halophilus JSM 076056 = DSM 19796]